MHAMRDGVKLHVEFCPSDLLRKINIHMNIQVQKVYASHCSVGISAGGALKKKRQLAHSKSLNKVPACAPKSSIL